MFSTLRNAFRHTTAFVRYYRGAVDATSACRDVESRLAAREASFLAVVERCIFANPRSPFRKLLLNVGMQPEDVASLVADLGLEAALVQLHDRGVYLTVEELRGRVAVRRGDLEFTVEDGDLDNPMGGRLFRSRSSGSSGRPTYVYSDFDTLAQESAYMAVLARAHHVGDRAIAVWRPIPPDNSGLNNMFRYGKIGRVPERWFSQSPYSWRPDRLRRNALLFYTLLVSRLILKPIPIPRYVPHDEAVTISRWLATKTARGTPAYFDSSVTGVTRVCLAAREHGLDISGSAARVGGEPLTPAKARIIAEAGVHVLNRYAMTEVGMIGLGCASSTEAGDFHVATDMVAVTQRDKEVGSDGVVVRALVYTSTSTTCRQPLINAESGDYGDISQRTCDCLLGELGLTTHLTGLRSYEKLTSEGVTFLGSELYDLLENVLPARFGGYATDYQLVEEEEEGVSRVSVIVSPSVGEVDDTAVIATILSSLDAYFRPQRRMADTWRRADTLRVLRREPHVASNGRKVLPLHVLRPPTP